MGMILCPGAVGQHSPFANVGLAAGHGVIPQDGPLIHKCPVGSDGVVIDPGILVLTGEVALMLYKTAQVPGFDLAADIP